MNCHCPFVNHWHICIKTLTSYFFSRLTCVAYYPFVNHWHICIITMTFYFLFLMYGFLLSLTHLLVSHLYTNHVFFLYELPFLLSVSWSLSYFLETMKLGFVCEFQAETDERICFLNVCPDEIIRSLFYNKNNDSLITVSVYASENFSSLKCRSTKIECVHSVSVHPNPPLWCLKLILLTWSFIYVLRYLRRGKPDAGFPLFQSESLKWPGFVEFDDVNGKVLTYSAQDWYLPHFLVFLFHFYCYVSVCSAGWLFYPTHFLPMVSVFTRSLILRTTPCYTRF